MSDDIWENCAPCEGKMAKRIAELEAERNEAIDHMTAFGVEACRERDARIAELEALKVCATCEYESDPEWLDGPPYCQQHDLMQVGYHDPCHFKPSRWAERGTE